MITMVYSYFDNPKMLGYQLAEWSSYGPELARQFRFVVVDDGSPTYPAAEVLKGQSVAVELYRIKQNIAWNFHGARNLGMDRAPDGWCLISDIDHVLEAAQARSLAEKQLKRGHFYIPGRRYLGDKPVHPHPDTSVMERSLYWQVGGCDEDFSGWYSPGELYLHNAATVAAREDMADIYLRLVTVNDVPDANTTAFGRKGSAYHWKKNAYLQRKWRALPYRPENPLRFEWERVA